MKLATATIILVITTNLFAQDPSLLAKLIDRRDQVKQWAVTCEGGGYSETVGECDQHDITLFGGISCLAATLAGDKETETARCQDVAGSQGANGRWWRGPTRVDDGKINAFSRDMARGVHAYLVASGYVNQDLDGQEIAKEKALAWLKWISSDEADRKLCTEFTKNRCRITSGSRNLFYSVYKILNILPKKGDQNFDEKLIRKIHKSKNYTKSMFWFETKFLTGKGYPRHLKATSLLINRVLNTSYPEAKLKSEKTSKKLNRVAKSLYKRDKENLLMEFMHLGLSDNFQKRIFESCPQSMPLPNRAKRDFRWQRDQGNAPQDGHDCIYLLNLAIAKLNNRLVY